MDKFDFFSQRRYQFCLCLFFLYFFTCEFFSDCTLRNFRESPLLSINRCMQCLVSLLSCTVARLSAGYTVKSTERPTIRIEAVKSWIARYRHFFRTCTACWPALISARCALVARRRSFRPSFVHSVVCSVRDNTVAGQLFIAVAIFLLSLTCL